MTANVAPRRYAHDGWPPWRRSAQAVSCAFILAKPPGQRTGPSPSWKRFRPPFDAKAVPGWRCPRDRACPSRWGQGLFPAGHDLKEMHAHRGDADGGKAILLRHTFAICSKLMQTIVNHPPPVLAEIDGVATAAGCQLVASCDLAISVRQGRASASMASMSACSAPRPRWRYHARCNRNACHGDAADRRDDRCVDGAGVRPSSPASCPAEYLNQIVTKYAQVIAAKSPTALRLGTAGFLCTGPRWDWRMPMRTPRR